VFWLDIALYVLVTLAVVISVQTIGNILVLALLIAPAATARLLTSRLGVMMALAPALGAAAALVGLYVSWSWDVPTGGTIVLVLSAFFVLAWFFAPKYGWIARYRRSTAPLLEERSGATEATGPSRHPADALI
jgi:manganese/iron transport system permease protein